MTTALLLAPVAFVLAVYLFAIALCRAAGRADRWLER